MSKIVKLSIIGAALAGAAVGTIAFLRHRSASQAEMLDFDEMAEAIGDASAEPVVEVKSVVVETADA